MFLLLERQPTFRLVQKDSPQGCLAIFSSSSEQTIVSCNENGDKTKIVWVEQLKCSEDEKKKSIVDAKNGCYFNVNTIFLKEIKTGIIKKIIQSNNGFDFIYWFGNNIGFYELQEAGEGVNHLHVYNNATELWQDGPGVKSEYFDDFAVYTDNSNRSPSSCAPGLNDGKIVLMNLTSGSTQTLLEEQHTMYDVKSVINSSTPKLFFTSVSVKGDIKGCVESVDGSAIERTLDIKI